MAVFLRFALDFLYHIALKYGKNTYFIASKAPLAAPFFILKPVKGE